MLLIVTQTWMRIISLNTGFNMYAIVVLDYLTASVGL